MDCLLIRGYNLLYTSASNSPLTQKERERLEDKQELT